ncbi:hypothetical protein JXB28_06145 [Candidatus Woesearchaeota archaeon]|nr:hypothetical protein [Candidatus Woesearchaeota archaeon]
MNKKTKELLKTSKKVIRECSLPNGAIVAANSSKPYFPKQAKDYRFVWPRDAMYACIAAKIPGLKIQEKFFRWCMKAEGWSKTGLFYEKYYANGKKALRHFQPDQTGSILIAIHDYYKGNRKGCEEFRKLITKSANGLCKVWDHDHFGLVTQDLWEERLCFPDLKGNFTYSIAICARGLECANEIIPNQNWKKTSDEMRRALQKNSRDYFYRSFGKIDDKRVDASLLGLLWPAELIPVHDRRMRKTADMIEDRLVRNNRVYRYEHDEYDGWMYDKATCRRKGAGYWPLLNLWMTMYHLKAGNRNKALRYYDAVLHDMKGKKYIPEQFFDNQLQVSVSPLCWAHSMFIIASKELGYF